MGDSTFSCCAYCWKDESSWSDLLNFKCDGCGKRVHYECIRSSSPSPLLDDTFFNFKCEACGENGKEEFHRSNMSWLNVVTLTLYNLQKMGQGKCGYFHWKSHICGYISTHWVTFFGHQRKKTTLWMGTVAGTLSSGCPLIFVSGANVVEQGYWRLAKLEPPRPGAERKPKGKRRAIVHESPIELNPQERRCRRSGENSLAAAIELKEKRSTLTMGRKDTKKSKQSKEEENSTNSNERNELVSLTKTDKPSSKKSKSTKAKPKRSIEMEDISGPTLSSSYFSCPVEPTDSANGGDSHDTVSAASSERSLQPCSLPSSFKGMFSKAAADSTDVMSAIKVEIESDDEFDIDIGSMGTMPGELPDLRPSTPDLGDMLNSANNDITTLCGKSPVSRGENPWTGMVKTEPQSDEESEGPSEGDLHDKSDVSDDDEEEDRDEESEEEDEDEDTSMRRQRQEADDEGSQMSVASMKMKKKKGRPRKRRRPDDAPPPSPPPILQRISVFEEGELLQKLNVLAMKQSLRPELAQLRRKLICNQTNREFGLPVFDLDSQMINLAKAESNSSVSRSQPILFFPKLPTKSALAKETRDLDRFMMHKSQKKTESRTYTSFHQRLVGLEDHELKPVISPYTTRVLLPFIWRNYNPSRKPPKMQLLEEIRAYPHRNDPSWVAPQSAPIDYCYVRPEHIPSVNALCREFFWPGIDMSECLQYPDFSCVVLYRKIVIAFAFMVPDRGYNEAYISFIFTLPEWQGCGIATFMLYHLIQTCMGKDVLLHVSATNPAMLLYQRFGFKAQEFIVNFYHKYFPLNCKDSCNAFLMRLSR